MGPVVLDEAMRPRRVRERRSLPGWLRLDRAELGVLLALVTVSAVPLALLVWQVVVDGKIWLGIDGGPVVQDQMQYVNWIRDASEHVLISNHYQAEPTERSYLHPGALVSAGLVRLGAAPTLGYMLWKPVAVLALFAAICTYVRRLLPSGPARWAALILALFFLPPTALIEGHGLSLTVASVEVWPIDMLWGYYFSALAVAALVAALIVYERDRRSGRPSAWPPLLGFLATWLQPWEGPLLIGVIVGAEAFLALSRRRAAPAAERAEPAPDLRGLARLALPTVAVTFAPLVYYVVLGRVDPSWSIDPDVHRFLDPSWGAIAVTIAPLALPALLAYRRWPVTFHEAALRVWPLVALALYWLLTTAYPGHYAPHALRGLSIPLAVLAVAGVGTIRWRYSRSAALAAAAAALFVLTVPATVDKLHEARQRLNSNTGPYFLTRGERDALDYLDRDRAPGSVYAPARMGQLIPAETGRRTNVGNLFWTPDYLRRRAYTELMFHGALSRKGTRALVRYSGSRFVFSGCDGSVDLAPILRPMLASVRRFGCASVYEIKPSSLRRLKPS